MNQRNFFIKLLDTDYLQPYLSSSVRDRYPPTYFRSFIRGLTQKLRLWTP